MEEKQDAVIDKQDGIIEYFDFLQGKKKKEKEDEGKGEQD